MAVTTDYLGAVPQRRAAFDKALRHSRRVAILRKLLPVAGVAALLGFAVAARLSAPGSPDFSVARTTIERNAVVMESPVLTGYDARNRQYRVSAGRAVQKLASPNKVRLEDIRAEISVEGRGSAVVTAAGGDFDNNRGTLVLYGGLSLQSDDGIIVRMKNADIDFESAILKSTNPVTIIYRDSETTADSIVATQGGKSIVMQGHVHTRLMPPKRRGANADARQPALPGGQ